MIGHPREWRRCRFCNRPFRVRRGTDPADEARVAVYMRHLRECQRARLAQSVHAPDGQAP